MPGHSRDDLIRKAIALTLSASWAMKGQVGLAQQAVESEVTRPSVSGEKSGEAGGLQEVIVTATRRASSAMNVPYNLSVVTESQMERSGTFDFSKLSQAVPGLVYSGGGIRQGSPASIIIRGMNVGQNNTGDLPNLTVPLVSTYINDTPIFVNLHISDVQRIEVLRGPQGTLYGNGSMGGTLRFIYNEPDPSGFSVKVLSDVGHSENSLGPNYNLDGVLNLPLAEGLAFRVSAGHEFIHGVIDAKNLYASSPSGLPLLADPSNPITSLPVPYSRRNIDDSELTYAHSTVKYENGSFKAMVFHHYQNESAEGETSDTPGTGPVTTLFSPTLSPGFLNPGFDAAFPPQYARYQTGIFLMQPSRRHVNVESLDLSNDFGFATLSSVTSYSDDASNSTRDLSSSYQSFDTYYGFPRMAVASQRIDTDRRLTEEVRLVSNGQNHWQWVVGAFYQDEHEHFYDDDRILGWSEFATALFGAPYTQNYAYLYDRRTLFRDRALFGELTYRLTDHWLLTAGVRAADQKLDITTSSQQPICGVPCSGLVPPDSNGTALGAGANTHRPVLKKINVSYQVDGRLTAYATYSEGFRRGGASGVPTEGPFAQPSQFLTYEPDRAKSYEIGMKARPTPALDLTADVYQVSWQRPQLDVVTPVGFYFAATNGKSATIRGVEFQASVHSLHGVSASLGYSYTDAKLDEPFNVGPYEFGSAGERLPGTPVSQLFVATDYARATGTSSSYFAHLDTAYRSSISTGLSGTAIAVPLPGFWMWNANTGMQFGQLTTTAYIDNIFNARGVTGRGILADFRSATDWISRPRTIGVRVSYSWRK